LRVFQQGSRKGFGTTTTFVLVIIGIALMILLGGDLLSRGSRISIERAYATGQLLRIAAMALDEATRSEAGRERIADSMLAAIAQGTPPAKTDPQARDDLINDFIAAITPYDPSTGVLESLYANVPPPAKDEETLIPHKHPWGRDDQGNSTGNATGMLFWGTELGRVVFGTDPSKNAKFKPETLRLAYKHELDARVLKIEDVEMRALAFKAGLTRDSSNRQIRRRFVQNETMGYGAVRAQVVVSWAMSKGPPIVRTVICDRFFELIAPAKLASNGGLGEETEWTIKVLPGEWQRVTLGD
jgi:hypothetical protein